MKRPRKDIDDTKSTIRTSEVIGELDKLALNATGVTLPGHYEDIRKQPFGNVERRVERIQDAVRQFIEARKNLRMAGQMKDRRETLLIALEDSLYKTGEHNDDGNYITSVRLLPSEVSAAVASIVDTIDSHIIDAREEMARQAAEAEITKLRRSAAQTMTQKISEAKGGNSGPAR